MKSKFVLLITAGWLGCLSSSIAAVQSVVTVANIAELKSLNIAPTNVMVLGYYTPGDRGGGLFEWDPNSGDGPDDGYYIATNGWSSGNGRWIRRLNGEVPNVKMWGAKGDIYGGEMNLANVAAAHDDTTNIQNAIESVGHIPFAQSHAELLIPLGWYKVTSTLILYEQVRLRGESSRMCHLVMPYGSNNDILHTAQAQNAMNGVGTFPHYDGRDRIEDLAFNFAFNTDAEDGRGTGNVGHNQTNAAIVICSPEEGSTIRNVEMFSGGYGIRCLGDGGAVAAFRDISCLDTAIAGICFEPEPGKDSTEIQVSIKGISGDHRWDETRSNACLVKFINYYGPATIEDVNTEGIYGGGIVNHQFPAALSAFDIGNLTIKNCFHDGGPSFGNYDAPRACVVLKSAGLRTSALTMENVHLYGVTNLIRDELTGRDVPCTDANADALHQAVVRLPLEYESYNNGLLWTDGVTPDEFSRLVVGGQAIYSFMPPTTNAWYRILQPVGLTVLSSKATVSSLYESSEFSVNVLAASVANAVELNVTRTMKDNVWPSPPCVTKVRAGSYQDSAGQTYPFADIYVERAIPPLGISDYNFYQITVACPVYDYPNISAHAGAVCLRTPTTALSSIVPAGCTLLNCVTNSLVR